VDGARVGTGERELHLARATASTRSNSRRASSTSPSGTCTGRRRCWPIEDPLPGSLIELDFGEQEQEKSVVVIDAQAQRPPSIELVEVAAGRRLRTVEGTLADIEHLAGERSDDYLRVRLKAEAPAPGLADRVKELLPNALDVTVDHPRNAGAQPSAARAAASSPPPSSSPPTTSTATRPLRTRPPETVRPGPRGGREVRPHRLTLEGFTSFRDKIDLDFTGLDSSPSPARPAPASRP